MWRDEERWTYFMGGNPIYSHAHDDLRMFRLTAAQLIDTGTCRACEIIRTFGVSKSSIDRALRLYREEGAEGFFRNRRSARARGSIMTPEVIQQAQELLEAHASRRAISDELEIPYTALAKAIEDGRLHESEPHQQFCSTKSDRSTKDADAAEGMGTGCTRLGERILAALGVLDGAQIRFEPCCDVPYGGVLCALPALLSNGLLSGIDKSLGKLGGYYNSLHVLLLLGFMALTRIKTVESLRGKAPHHGRPGESPPTPKADARREGSPAAAGRRPWRVPSHAARCGRIARARKDPSPERRSPAAASLALSYRASFGGPRPGRVSFRRRSGG